MMDLQDKVALVTGGGTGIGRATSLTLASHGAAVAINYSRSRDEAVSTVNEIQEAGGRAIAARADVSRDGEVREMVGHVAAELGAPQLLVNNASVTRMIPFEDLDGATDEIWDELLAVNVKGMFHCARAVAPHMKERGEGAIVNLGSIAGLTGSGSSLPYAVSKSAVVGLTKSLSRALAPRVRVCCVVPGFVPTRWWAGSEEGLVESLSNKSLLQRTTSPEDVAGIVRDLLSQEAMTGQTLTVDGGQTL